MLTAPLFHLNATLSCNPYSFYYVHYSCCIDILLYIYSEAIFAKLDRIEDKLDGKVDK